MIDRERILKFFGTCTRPLSFKEIVSQMGLDGKEVRQLKRILRDLVRSGELIRTRKGRYGSRSEERRVGKECRSRWSPEH